MHMLVYSVVYSISFSFIEGMKPIFDMASILVQATRGFNASRTWLTI
jgi:hypothetical protein